MLSLPPSVRLFVARDPCDMRKSFDGLAGIVRNVMRDDPLSGHLYVFFNRRGDRAKILWWDRTGFFLLAKRLEKGRFTLPEPTADASGTTMRITAPELMLILEGIDLRSAKRRPRYAHKSA
jgi:transposase